MNSFVALLLLASTTAFCVSVTTALPDVTITVQVTYPVANLGPYDFLTLRGSPPLSWESGVALVQSNSNANLFLGTVTISSQLMNETNPYWQIGMKTLVNDSIWQLGRNHRVDLVYPSPAQVATAICPYYQQAVGMQTNISSIFSPQLNNTRPVWMYVPAQMIENTLCSAASVIVMHDGQNLAPLWNVPQHLDKAIANGVTGPIFIIGPYNTGLNRINEYTYSVDPTYGGGEGDLYLDFIEKTLIPQVALMFPTLDMSASNLGTIGSSLGGLIACYAGVTRPQTYGKLGCMSSSFWWNFEDFERTIVPKLKAVNGQTQLYYIDSGDAGDSDDDRLRTSQVTSSFIGMNVGFQIGSNLFWYLQRGGHHNEYYWSLRFHVVLQYMYGRDGMQNDSGGSS